MNIILIGAVIALIFVFISFKMNNFRTKIAFIFIILGVSFLLITAYYVSADESPDLSKLDKLIGTGKIYASWLFNTVGNLFKITSYTIKENIGNETKLFNKTK